MLIGPSKIVKWAEGDEWEWKKPFQELKKSVIHAEDKWHIRIKVDEDELDDIYAMCDGRLRVETLYARVEPEKAEETDV